jgi:hypothetical protein
MPRAARGMAGVAVTLLVITGLAACGGGSSKKNTTQSSEPPTSATPSGDFTISASEYRFDAPQTVLGGVVKLTLKNTGSKAHEGAFVRVGDTPQEQVVADLGKVVDGGPIPAYMGLAGGVGTLQPGTDATATSTLKLTPGKYLFVCTLTDDDTQAAGTGSSSTSSSVAGATTSSTRRGATTTSVAGATTTTPQQKSPAHFTQGMVAPITVEGDTGQALPAGGPTISAKDYGFDTSGLAAGDQTVLFQNTGPKEFHLLDLEEFPAGTSESAALKAFQALAKAGQAGNAPPAGTIQPKTVGSAPPIESGFGETLNVTLQAGRVYILACFIQDRTGGAPHAFSHNMIKVITIPKAGSTTTSISGRTTTSISGRTTTTRAGATTTSTA